MSGILCAVASGGSRPIIDTQTVTRGYSGSGINPTTEHSGYKNVTPNIGSISDGTADALGGASIIGLYFTQTSYESPPSGYVARSVILRVSTAVANSGFEVLTIGTTEFLRSSATFTTGTGYSQWEWSVAIPDPFANGGDPFSSTTVCTWS